MDCTAHSDNDALSTKKLVRDCGELEQQKLSTGTPGFRTLSPSAVPQVALQDSGFNELAWSVTFAKTCSISGTISSHNASFELPSTFQDDCPLLAQPLQKVLKFSDYDNDAADYKHVDRSHGADSAFGDCSSSHSNHFQHLECDSDMSSQYSVDHAGSLCVDDPAELPTPSNIHPWQFSNAVITPAHSRCIYSSTPFAASTYSVSTGVQKIVETFSPKVRSRLIGRHMGLDTIDVVKQLNLLGLTVPLSMIMKNLDGEDVCRCEEFLFDQSELYNSQLQSFCTKLHSSFIPTISWQVFWRCSCMFCFRMCLVSREWKLACDSNHVAQWKKWVLAERRRELKEELQKENLHAQQGSRKKLTRGREVPLTVVQDVAEEKKPKTQMPLPTNYQQFVQVCLVVLIM